MDVLAEMLNALDPGNKEVCCQIPRMRFWILKRIYFIRLLIFAAHFLSMCILLMYKMIKELANDQVKNSVGLITLLFPCSSDKLDQVPQSLSNLIYILSLRVFLARPFWRTPFFLLIEVFFVYRNVFSDNGVLMLSQNGNFNNSLKFFCQFSKKGLMNWLLQKSLIVLHCSFKRSFSVVSLQCQQFLLK